MSLAGRYELGKVLGEGGMGRVVRATDLELGREVAVKLLLAAALGNQEVRSRFGREARILAGTRHPHLVELYDQDLEAVQPYLVMELVEGEDLSEVLFKDGPRPLDFATRLAGELGGALDHLHENGVFHRDLKPSNVMVRRRDGSAVVMDLGLAHASGATALTRTGKFVGTAFWLPPEVLLGAGWTAASDQYQLALILFEVLTGTRWIPGETLEEVTSAIAAGTRVPWPGDLPGVPAAHRRVLERAAALDPGARYPSCVALAEALAAGEPGGASSGRETSGGFDRLATSTAVAPGAARRSAPALAGIFVLALVGGLLLSRRPPPGDVRWQVVGDALVVSFRDPGRDDVRLRVGDREVAPGPADPGGRRRAVFRGLGPDPVAARLVWGEDASPPFSAAAARPAVHRRVTFAAGGGLEVTLREPAAAWIEPAPRRDLPAGSHVLPAGGPAPWVLAWEEEGVAFRRTLEFHEVVDATRVRLRTLAAGVDPGPVLRRRQHDRARGGRNFEPERAAWRGLAERLDQVLAADLPRDERLWFWREFERWAFTVAQERALGEDPAELAPPPGAPGERRMAGEARPDLGPSRALPLEPIGGFGHERVDFLALTTAESQKLPHERYTSAALALRFSWPAPPAGGGDPWFGVAVSGLRRTETLLVHAADAGGRDRTLAFRIWHPRPTETLERSAAGWFLVRLPGDLLPAPGTSMQLEARPLLNDSAIRIRILEAALWWPGGSGQSSR